MIELNSSLFCSWNKIDLFFDSNCDSVEHKAAAGYKQVVGSAVPASRSFRPAFPLWVTQQISETQVFFVEILQKANAKETRKSAGWARKKNRDRDGAAESVNGGKGEKESRRQRSADEEQIPRHP
jgi:hypothetical protein